MDDVLLGGNDYFCQEQNYNTIHKNSKRMKKHILVALCALFSMGTLAQTGEKAVGLNVSYGTEIKNIGIGVKGQYNFTDVIRGEASFDYFLKKDGLSMWDVNLNAHLPVSPSPTGKQTSYWNGMMISKTSLEKTWKTRT